MIFQLTFLNLPSYMTKTAHCHTWRWIVWRMVAALNYSAFRIIFYGVLPVKNIILYRLYLTKYIDIMDSTLEIKLLTCFFSSVNGIKQYIFTATYWCVCVRARVCECWWECEYFICISLWKGKMLPLHRSLFLQHIKCFATSSPHLNSLRHEFVYINISLLIFSVIEIYQPLEFLYIL